MRATSFHQLFLIKSTSRILYIYTYCGQKIFLQYYPFWRRGHEIIFIFPFFCKLRLYAWSRILLNFASASQSTNRLYDAYIQRVFATRINNIDILRDRNHEYTRRSKKSYEKKIETTSETYEIRWFDSFIQERKTEFPTNSCCFNKLTSRNQPRRRERRFWLPVLHRWFE